MQTLEKIGYILIGVGIGGLIATTIYEYELNKAVGEVEEYIPSDDTENSDISSKKEKDTRKNDIDSDSSIMDFYKSSSTSKDITEDIDAISHRNTEVNQKTAYHKMYRNNDNDILELDDSPEDDIAYEEDVEALDNELVRDRVEQNFEIYLGENPQDFITLIFYQGDETLTDDQERLVPNPDDIVGNVAINRLIEGGPGAEEGVIYVRNLKTMLNYEIVLDAGSYKNTVLGIFDSRRNNGAGRNGNT